MRRFNHSFSLNWCFCYRFNDSFNDRFDCGNGFNGGSYGLRFGHDRLYLYLFDFLSFWLRILRTRYRVADPHFAGRHFWRGAGNCQRHRRLQRVTFVTITTTTLAAHTQMTWGTTGATRHTGVIACLTVVILLWGRFCHDRQWHFHQLGALRWCSLCCDWCDNALFCGGGFYHFHFGRIAAVADFLVQLTLFTAWLSLTNALFLFGFRGLLLVKIQRFYFLLRLTFVFAATAVTFATWLLLFITRLRFIRYVGRLLTVITVFGILLRIAAVTAILVAVLAIL